MLQKIIVPISIVIAGGLIAVAIYYSNNAPTPGNTAGIADIAKNAATPKTEIAPVTSVDHVQGNPEKATVTIIEYSDTECPFCKRHHNTPFSNI